MGQSRNCGKTYEHRSHVKGPIPHNRHGRESFARWHNCYISEYPPPPLPRQIEKEIFNRLTPCYNCNEYDHKTQSCPKEKKIICANCGQTGHHQNICTSESSKCINCGGTHKTLAAVCPVRKDLIKSRGKLVRDRSRSRSMARTSSANSITNNIPNNNIPKCKVPTTTATANFYPPPPPPHLTWT